MNAISVGVHKVYAVVGLDRFMRNEALEGIMSALAGEIDTLGPTGFDGGQAELAAVLDEVRTRSLLGGRRVVVVDEAASFITANRSALERYCESPAESGSLILLCNSLAKNTRLYKIISRTGVVLTPEAPKGRYVITWLSDRARTTYGKRMSGAAARMLLDHLGDALGSLDAELSKLATYVGARDQIMPADIESLTGKHRQEKIFAVTDAMSSHDVAGALRHWEQVLATDRAAPGRALAGLAWGVRQLLDARRAWEGGAGLGDLARRMYTQPEVLRRRLESVTTDRLEDRQRDLLAADLAVKTGLSTVDVAVEKFIVKHTGCRPEDC